ncbi:MAG: UDP-N-acetylglucosamine 2-epimerase (non-hydrolyzing) [Bacillota bacterium]
MLKIMTVFGTRPEAIKMAPLVKELKQTPGFNCLVAVTAQHREMLDGVLEIFQLRPDYDLDIMKSGQTLTQITSRVIIGLEEILVAEKPDLVLVHGDTSTTFAASLAAFYHKIPVGHVEAGLRTSNKYSPYPEEMNRRLTGVIADWHYAPTQEAKSNLLKENISPQKIFVTGNTVIDALLTTVQNAEGQFTYLNRWEAEKIAALSPSRKILLLTAHRRENLGGPMKEIFGALDRIVAEFPQVELIFPVHKNPLVRELAQNILGANSRIHLIEPLDYAPFVNLMNRAHLILTDSGGLQEEAPALGKPVLVLRDTTERPEAVKAGTVALVGTDGEAVYNQTKALLTNDKLYSQMAEAVNPYGDGQASRRIAAAIKYSFNLSEQKPQDFV